MGIFITSSNSCGIINMFHPDRISRGLLSTQSTVLENSFLFGWGSVSSAAKRCSCVSLCLFCASARTQRQLTEVPTPIIPVQNGRWGESVAAGQRWKASMWLATWEQHWRVLAVVCETTSWQISAGYVWVLLVCSDLRSFSQEFLKPWTWLWIPNQMVSLCSRLWNYKNFLWKWVLKFFPMKKSLHVRAVVNEASHITVV